jgi:proline dehydrogenase
MSAGSPLVQRLLFPLATRFVAGDTIADALGVVERLRADGLRATVAVLGEDVEQRADAERAADAYARLIDALAERALPAHLSLKLSALGARLGDGSEVERYAAIVAQAARTLPDPFVRVDMEGSATVDATLAAVAQTFATHPNTGPVLQASLHRTPADVADAVARGMRVRLCKGAYAEPATVALRDAGEIRAAYLACATVLLREGATPAFATHDPAIIEAIRRAADAAGRSRDTFEFQLLYGVRGDLQRSLVRSGYAVRVYVPYGTHWAKYFRRRVMERRENLLFAMRSVLARNR